MSRYSSSYWGDEDDDYGYGYGYNYYSNKNKGGTKYNSYSWKPSTWSSYSWFGGVDEDDDSDLFVKDPVTYLTPTKADIKKKTRAISDKSVDTIKELARVCYYKMIDEKNYISEKFSDFESLSEQDQVDYGSKKELYDSIFDTYIPGNTPLEQAIAIYKKISNDKEYAESSDEENLDLKSTLSFDRQVYANPEINNQLEFNELSKDRKMDILDRVSIVGDFGEQFKVEKEVDEKIVSNSDQYAKKIMRDYAQFSNIELYQKMFPNFATKFLTKDLTVNVPVDKKEQKQKIIILLDYSGSMDDYEKQIWVNAILIDRLRYVMQGEAEVFFSYFVYDKNDLKFHHLKNREDVMDFWTWFSNDPNGGCTDIGAIVKYVAECVEDGDLHNLDIDLSKERPEILIINDGQDSVDSKAFPYKVNAISLMQFSDELKDLCVATGGKQIQVSIDDSVISYSGEGKTVVNDGKNTKKIQR